ncbi:MOSC domain-containing protein [Streptomonospora nanhaiensis]|uniref:MOSC domain-containing protein YiiM n=1 Tax=Streptomonospora nanhaiensis TaxID=1323731 RepID=A0A853BJI9_9ACTN|nr:MOSC domain-containing protein [Streptomonospora nanhaiensis]MBV2363066.1 MOSC domain-containing protein [Streptomonospora nanhaiensis]MBX9388918.1 MOSC domain-containing protein [Streptomonospora nanhaiensis]NYI95433.1 MOSC domain-containing protein YiiM [Streptomonospora nanhaiensis]
MPTSVVRSVNTGRAVSADWAGRLKRTAIDKRPAEGPVAAGRLGLAGDQQADTEHHGGADQAVYAYSREDLDRWQERLGRPLRDGVFGENLTTEGVDLHSVLIGERWAVGTAEFEAVLPRTPCGVFQAWMAESGWVRTFTQEGRTGVYLRVTVEGTLAAGDEVRVLHRPDHGITIAAGFAAKRDRDLGTVRRIAALPGRAAEWGNIAAHLERALAR